MKGSRQCSRREEIEKKLEKCEDRLEILTKRYEWTLSSEELKRKKRLIANVKKLTKQLQFINDDIPDKSMPDDDEMSVTTLESCDTISTICSVTEPHSDSFSRSFVPMMPLIPPTPTKVDSPPASPKTNNSTDPEVSNNKTTNSTPINDCKKDGISESSFAYNIRIPRGLFNGFSLMILVGLCAKWYFSSQRLKR